MDRNRADVSAVPGVEEAVVVQGDAAREELERLFASDPAALETLLAAGVPAWMKVKVGDPAILDQVETLVQSQPGFTSFQTTDGIPTDGLSDADLARWCGAGD